MVQQIVDSHQHVWDLGYTDYPWLGPEHGVIHGSFRQDDVEPELSAVGIDYTVLVQAMDSLADTRYMLATADRFRRVAGVVGWVPLEVPRDAERALERWCDDPRFVGVRHLIHEDPDPDWLRRPSVQDGLELLVERDLTFDVVAVLPRHLENVAWLAERHPQLRLVIDHLAKPPIATGGWQPWADLLAAASQHPNVYAKVSGLNTAADPVAWDAEDLRPYVAHAIECFGARRLMYGGDWPVTLLAGGYARVWAATNLLLSELIGDQERDMVLGSTAVQVYGLSVPAHDA